MLGEVVVAGVVVVRCVAALSSIVSILRVLDHGVVLIHHALGPSWCRGAFVVMLFERVAHGGAGPCPEGRSSLHQFPPPIKLWPTTITCLMYRTRVGAVGISRRMVGNFLQSVLFVAEGVGSSFVVLRSGSCSLSGLRPLMPCRDVEE